MNHPPASDDRVGRDSDPLIAWLNGDWVSPVQLVLPMDDIGFRFGATAVERLRTYGGRVFCLEDHLIRWQRTVQAIRIDGLPSTHEIFDAVQQVIVKNEAYVARHGDVGITIVATPGVRPPHHPTFAIHLNRLDRERISHRRREGQPIVVTDVQQPPNACWPRSIKVRSRLHYYLADMTARQFHADASGLLIDSDGTITETSISNVAIVIDGSIRSPRGDRVLGGVTQGVVERLAASLELDWIHDHIDVPMLRAADEVLLMGTETGIWFADRIDGRSVGDGAPGACYRQLLRAFDEFVSS